MNFMKKQKGFSLLSLVFVIIAGAVVLLYGSQIGIVYLDKRTVQSAVKASLAENKTNSNSTTTSIKSDIFKRLSMNDIDSFDSDSVTVLKKSGGYSVDIKMEKNISVTENISILVNYEFTEDTE